MFKKTRNPNPAPKTERTSRTAKIAVVGAAVALALSVTPLFGTNASANGGVDQGACVRASTEEGKFVGEAGACGGSDAQPIASETPTAPFALTCRSPASKAIETTWSANLDQGQRYRVEVTSSGNEWKLAESVSTPGFRADGRTLIALLGHEASGAEIGTTYSGGLRVVYDNQGATRISKPIWFSVTTTVVDPDVVC